MKIIIKGSDKTYPITCTKCNSDLEYTENDMYITTKEKYSYSIENRVTKKLFNNSVQYRIIKEYYNVELKCIKCPVCESEIPIEKLGPLVPPTTRKEIASEWRY